MSDSSTSPTAALRQYIEIERERLLPVLRLYLYKAGLAQSESLAASAQELLNEVVVEALAHAERFDPARSPQAWLLGIAANLIKRQQVALAKQTRREALIHDLYPASEILSQDEAFDLLLAASDESDPAHRYEAHEQVTLLLERLSEDEQKVLRLAILHEMDGAGVAAALGISAGAARVRLFRALNRLRQIYAAQIESEWK